MPCFLPLLAGGAVRVAAELGAEVGAEGAAAGFGMVEVQDVGGGALGGIILIGVATCT